MNSKALDWLEEAKAKDTDNILAPPITYGEFTDILIHYLLGDDWYVNYSCGLNQVATEALFEILSKYSKNFNREYRYYKRHRDER